MSLSPWRYARPLDAPASYEFIISVRDHRTVVGKFTNQMYAIRISWILCHKASIKRLWSLRYRIAWGAYSRRFPFSCHGETICKKLPMSVTIPKNGRILGCSKLDHTSTSFSNRCTIRLKMISYTILMGTNLHSLLSSGPHFSQGFQSDFPPQACTHPYVTVRSARDRNITFSLHKSI